MKVRRYNGHSAGSLSWPVPVVKYKYIFQIKYTKAILSNSTRKLLWFEITKMLIALLKSHTKKLRKKNYVIYCNFRHTSIPCRWHSAIVKLSCVVFVSAVA